MLLVGRQEGHPACKKTERWGAGVVIIIIILYYAIYGSTRIQKKLKIHLKYDLKYKKDMNTMLSVWSQVLTCICPS